MKLIFQLGTNNWQRDEEPAPGSGILHESQHNIMNSMKDVKCYSMFPSPVQTSTRDDYRVFKISHPIPICESSSPVSSYRWHSMSPEEFNSYRKRLENEVYEYMDKVEMKEGTHFTLIIAHHCFLNPLVMRNVVQKRMAGGKPRTPICCFFHGTGLKMFEHELNGENPVEYPLRFHKLLTEEKVFEYPESVVSVALVNSPVLLKQIARIFPKFPQERIIIATPGVDEKIFYPRNDVTFSGVLKSLGPPLWPLGLLSINPNLYDKIIVFVGKLADLKRVDALLLAAQTYEKEFSKVCTIIAGGGPDSYIKELTDLTQKLALKSVYFIGARSQQVLAQLFTVSSLGVFPSFEESFGMVFIECMLCGCPVIGAKSGGPINFMTRDVGELVPEPGMKQVKELSDSLVEVIRRAINEDWKKTKKDACIKLCKGKYTAESLTVEMLENTSKLAIG